MELLLGTPVRVSNAVERSENPQLALFKGKVGYISYLPDEQYAPGLYTVQFPYANEDERLRNQSLADPKYLMDVNEVVVDWDEVEHKFRRYRNELDGVQTVSAYTYYLKRNFNDFLK